MVTWMKKYICKYQKVFLIPYKRYVDSGSSLYGLKQASRQWFSKLSATIISLGYQQSKHDYSLFINKSSTDITIAAVYVDLYQAY